MDVVYVLVAVFALVVLKTVLHYQHEKTREKILERSKKLLSEEDVLKVDKVLDDMMGPEIRHVCSFDDKKFVCFWQEKINN